MQVQSRWCRTVIEVPLLSPCRPQSFFGVDWTDALSLAEVQAAGTRPSLPYNGTAASLGIRDWTDDKTGITYEYERVPRILHQTWKNDTLPERWAGL